MLLEPSALKAARSVLREEMGNDVLAPLDIKDKLLWLKL